ncbi:MAG: amidohydrolase [Planctomycetes bacterium]|nr:amidohydrolase [Planctomycetota bacterium]
MGLVDFHLHLFSRAYFEALAAQSTQPGGIDERLARVAERARIELPSQDLGAHVARWIAEFDRHGVEHAAVFASAPEEANAVADAAVLAKGRITPFALVNPRSEGAATRVRALLANKGFRGVLLFPALHHYDISAPECRELLAVLEEQRAIAYVHCGILIVKVRDLLELPRATDLRFASPLNLIPAANAFPNVRFVVPHFGAGYFRETLIAGAQCPNVFVDTSSTNSWIATQPVKLTLRDVFERTLSVFGPERILFGTDSNTFPSGWRAERLIEQRAIVELLAAPAAEAIFCSNARRLLAR